MSKIQSIRGMNDVLPSEVHLWRSVESTVIDIVNSFGYKEIRFPIVENTALFKRAIGEVTDIVEKEMYTFEDKNGDSLTLRPEGTASCVRACEQHGLLYNQTQKLWYGGPMFRHERPQKGRLRQFHQIGVEAFGFSGCGIDCEILLMVARIFQVLGVNNHIALQVNSLGTSEERKKYREALVSYLTDFFSQLDDDSQRRLSTNPLRILDSKVERTQDILKDGPVFQDYLGDLSKKEFESLCYTLDKLEISYQVNPRLVRGLDYYNGLVFEWITNGLGSQGTVCAGGRYDGLVDLLGGKPTPAFGCAFGIERLVLLISEVCGEATIPEADVYFVFDDVALAETLKLAQTCRNALPGMKVITYFNGGGFKAQFKRANKSGSRIAVVIGEEELAVKEVTVKFLRDERAQERVSFDTLPAYLRKNLG